MNDRAIIFIYVDDLIVRIIFMAYILIILYMINEIIFLLISNMKIKVMHVTDKSMLMALD